MRVHPSAFPLKTKKIMKKSLFMAAVLLLSLCMFTFSACDDNEEDKNVGKPVVALNEVGEENSKTAIAGSDLHLEGEITAENRIKRIDIEIHQEEGGEFRVEKSFTEGKYIGVKNTTFHEHIDIPAEAPAGAYHLHFTVTDQLGQTEMAESELAVKAAAAHITVEDLKFGASHDFSENKIGYVGTKPMVSAHIKAENGIEKIAVFIQMKKALGPLNWIPPTPSTVKRNGVRKASINTLQFRMMPLQEITTCTSMYTTRMEKYRKTHWRVSNSRKAMWNCRGLK